MRRNRWTVLLLGLLLATPAWSATLAERIDAHVAQPRFAHARWGIEVLSLDDGRVVYAHDADKLFVPASTAKLFTAALALEALGPAFRLPTRVFGMEPDAHGVVRGHAVLYGMGDPTLGADASTADWANQMAVQMTSRGIRRITGDLVADDTFFSTPPYGTGWEAGDLQARYGAQPSALSVSENAVRVTVTPAAQEGAPAQIQLDPARGVAKLDNQLITAAAGTPAEVNLYRGAGSDTLHAFGQVPLRGTVQRFPLSSDDPARVAGEALRDALARHGISLGGTVRVAHWPQGTLPLRRGTTLLAEVESPTLLDVLRGGLKRSQNLYLQNLWLMCGVRMQATQPPPGNGDGFISTEAWGLIGLRLLLDQWNIAADEVQLQEGSGLSRGDLVTPHAMTRVLERLSQRADAPAVRDTLPVAGMDGTLQARMKGTPAEGNVRAKTGTLSGVRGLAGYVSTAAGKRLAFTIFLNQYEPPAGAPPATADIDAIAVMLAGEAAP